MKNKINKLLFALVFIFGINLSAQETVNVQLNVFEQLPEISFAAFLTNPFLENTPRILQVIMSPHGQNVIVKGAILWRKSNGSSYEELFHYTTEPFTSRNFYNDDFSSIDGIELKDSESNDDLLEENLRIGKPSGSYEIIVEVYDENMNFQSTDTKYLGYVIPGGNSGENIPIGLVNPSQTISIITPEKGDKLDIGGIILTWTNELGISDFIIKANVRSSKFESLEEALEKGNPIVDNVHVGFKTSVNLREILDRELVGGEELVVQIRGTIKGPGGPSIVYSDIINFNILKPGSSSVERGTEEFTSLLTQVVDNLKQQSGGSGDIEQLVEQIQGLLDKIARGEMSFDDISITMEGGRRLSYPEFQQILNFLRNNPDLLTNLNYEDK